MAEAGYANGFKQLMEFFPATALTEPTALYLQAALKEIKIELELQKVEIGVFVNKIYKRVPISGIYLGAQDPTPLMDPDAILVWSFSGSGFGKRFNNPEFDRIYLQSAQEMDPVRREALIKQAFAIIQEDPSTLPLVTTSGLSAAKKDIGGITYRQGEDFYLLDEVFRTK
jgi:ABC-type transport system substrate-binding protein